MQRIDRPALARTPGMGVLGVTALALTVVIWAGYLVLTRAAARADMGPVEIGLLRYAPAALLFAPVWLRWGGVKPPGIGWRDAAIVGVCAGFLFISALATGLRFAPVADSGVFAPSMLPFFVAILSFFVLGERFGRIRLIGFALILFGALSVGGWQALSHAADGAWRGHLLFLTAAFMWAIYSVVYRRSGLGALDAAALIALWSTAAFAIIIPVFGIDYGGVSWRFLAVQLVTQGLLSGVVATFTYGYAVTAIGASRTAAFAALVPPLAALGGWAFLDEPIGWVKAAGIAVVACGVLLASGAISDRAAPRPARP